MTTKKHANFNKPANPDRTATIRGAIAPRSTPTPTDTEQQTQEPATSEDMPEATTDTTSTQALTDEQPAPENNTATNDEPAPVAAPNEPTKPVVFWVRTEVKTWVTTNAKAQHLSNADMIQQAIEGAYEALAAKAPAKAPTGRHLFAKAPKSAPRRRDGVDRAQLFARILQTNLEVIDTLVDDLSLGNRSVLVEEAVLTMINSKEN